MVHQRAIQRLLPMLAVAVLVVAGFVALSGRAEAAPLWRVGSDDYDCSGTLNSLMISHPGTTWIREGNYLVLLSDYGGNIRVPCTAPGQLTSLGPPVGVWESAPGILQPPSAYPGQ